MAGLMRCALVFVCVFALHFFSEQQVLCSQGLTRTAERPGLSYANFVEHLLDYLNVSQVGSSLVNDMTDCAIACLRVVTCFSYNVAANPDDDGRIICELLASDKYNFSEKFEANPLFHHFDIHNKCSDEPCVNEGKCIPLYYQDDFKCKCPPEFKGKKCKKDVDECKENKNNCSINAACRNTHGSFNCTCNDGFHGHGVKCDDIDECNENKHNCSSNATCHNTVGSFTCNCNDGFHGDGFQCNATAMILTNSEILRGHSDYEAKLREYLAPVQVSGKQWRLCFRASEHQYRATAFHTACDNKGPTVTLVRVGIYVFGGYTDKSWDGSKRTEKETTKVRYVCIQPHFLPVLTKKPCEPAVQDACIQIPTIRDAHLLYYGPTFGGGHDLYIANDCHPNTASYSNLGHTYSATNGYVYGSSQAQSLLAGSHSFKCDEYEVFYQL